MPIIPWYLGLMKPSMMVYSLGVIIRSRLIILLLIPTHTLEGINLKKNLKVKSLLLQK